MQDEGMCPLCGRNLGINWNKHHVKPKMFGGKNTVKIHVICHNKIHSIFSERELTQMSFDMLLLNEDIRKFVRWIGKKSPDFYGKTKQTKNRRQ